MRYLILLCCVIFCFPLGVFAAESSVPISVFFGDEKISELFIERAPGSVYHEVFRIQNNTDTSQEIAVFMEDAEQMQGDHESTTSLMTYTKFHIGALPQEMRDILAENYYDITAFCAKNGSLFAEWCNGKREVKVKIGAHESVDIPTSFHFDSREKDHRAYMVFRHDDSPQEELHRVTLQYHVPDKNLAEMRLKNFTLKKESSFGDLDAWIRSGLRDDYIAIIGSENSGTEDVQYTYFTEVESVWIGEKVFFSEDETSVHGEVHENRLHVTMPRFGKMRVIGGISYVDRNNQKIDVRSEPLILIVWPIHFTVIILASICFCVICVLLYKYIRKNMFGFRKRKKNKEEYTGTYIVRDTDNIISIAQMFGVPWKDLAQYNNIDAPYILISGETISVPAPQQNSSENMKTDDKEEIKGQNVDHVEGDDKLHALQQDKIPVGARDAYDVSDEAMYGDVRSTAHMQQKVSATQFQPKPQSQPQIVPRQQEPMKRKVTFAAPQSMLVQPASEPTTRAIDIEWMRDDEEAYNEEMEFQRRKINKRLIVFVVLGICILGGGVAWGVTKWMSRDVKEKVPVEALIKETDVSSADDQGVVTQGEAETEASSSEENVAESDNASQEDNEVQVNQKAPSDVTIQVLNAGAATGIAGSITKDFSDKGYKVHAAQNAQNSSNDVIIYHTKDMKDHLDAVSALIDEKHGTQKREESDEVAEKYDADIVVVLGA